MKYTYTLSLQDVLTYNQYNLSLKKKSKAIRIARVLITFYLLLTGGLLVYVDDYAAGIAVLVLGVAYPLLGGMYMKWAYTKAFKKAILSDLKGTINSPVFFELLNEHILITDQGGQSSYKLTSVESVIEIGNYFFIKITSSHVIIVPKSDEVLTNIIRQMISDHNLNHIVNLGWKY